jgi:hypothetical protein
MLDIRQRANDFDQARREANAAAALLDLEGGGAPASGPAVAALDQAQQKMEEAGPGDTAKTPFSTLGAMDGSKMDLDKETGLKDCKLPGCRMVGMAANWTAVQWTRMSSISRTQLCFRTER